MAGPKQVPEPGNLEKRGCKKEMEERSRTAPFERTKPQRMRHPLQERVPSAGAPHPIKRGVAAVHSCRGKILAFRNGREQKQAHQNRCGIKLDLTDRDGDPVIWEYLCEGLAVMKGLTW